MSGQSIIDLPQYLNNDDAATERRYQELLNLILTQWFNSQGFSQPIFTAAQVAALTLVPGKHWVNSTLHKMQFVDDTGTIQTVTST